jgi:polypeptide N-acetylgalactosaminyltransferase
MFPNPIMLGAAFAIGRKFFLDELGGYDEGLEIWNGENYELSFKLWMCADGLFTVPCSRVAHSFRTINPSRNRKDDFVAKNFMRIASVWLDEFKNLPVELEPNRYKNVNPGNLTIQKALRDKLKCRSFQWFLTKVAPDMIKRFPPFVDPPSFASGFVQSVANPRFCLDNLGKLFGQKLGVTECGNDSMEPGANQKFIYSFFKDIRQDHGRHSFCLDAWNLGMDRCNFLEYGNQFWVYDMVS